MKTITDIETQKRGRERVSIFLDGRFAFSVGRGVVEEHGLHPGQVLSDSRVEELAVADLFGKCLNAALRLLSYRPRSEAEIRTRLSRRFNGETIEGVILQLRERQMIDDVAFAAFWREARDFFSPRGRRLLKVELRNKGIDRELIDKVLNGIDDEESAYRAAQKRGRTLAKEDYETFRRKLGAFLRRRGFSYEVANRTTERLWQELG
ncbi:MAG: RecX family transcriptional regulator [Dehalococcoidia bacterium]|nr:RecX family transcriptional regulator [Dehalococcoidia bacterium]